MWNNQHVSQPKCKSIYIVLMLLGVVCACSNDNADPPKSKSFDYEAIALRFTQALTNRDYSLAYSITSTEFQTRTSQVAMKDAFEAIVPKDWRSIGPIEVGDSMTNWSNKRPSDLAWVYVSIGGDVYSEAVTVIVSVEGTMAKIREIECGRP